MRAIMHNGDKKRMFAEARAKMTDTTNALDVIEDALKGSIKLIGSKVINNVMPYEQQANYDALSLIQAIRDEIQAIEAADCSTAHAQANLLNKINGSTNNQ